MEKIVIDLKMLNELGININEYLVLYDIANELSISSIFDYGVKELVSLEKKGFIKLTEDQIFLREKGNKIFNSEEDLFEVWLNEYPIKVKTSKGSTRALSPASSDTILGQKLRNKWYLLFKKDIKAQFKAIEVLRAEVKDKTKSGDLEFMVEAARWLNEGFFEKMDHLIENKNDSPFESDNYANEDYL